LSFGHISFMCLGAYMTAWLTIPPVMKSVTLKGLPGWLLHTQLPMWVATPISGASQIVTANPNSHFNGCWLTIDVPIPPGYSAPQSGWWKIKYTMSGNGTSNDVTTWKVGIKGNPVHLITPLIGNFFGPGQEFVVRVATTFRNEPFPPGQAP
jgi:hypothetical protein